MSNINQARANSIYIANSFGAPNKAPILVTEEYNHWVLQNESNATFQEQHLKNLLSRHSTTAPTYLIFRLLTSKPPVHYYAVASTSKATSVKTLYVWRDKEYCSIRVCRMLFTGVVDMCWLKVHSGGKFLIGMLFLSSLVFLVDFRYLWSYALNDFV
ncbi:hypothetical protein LXL04_020053 [Taraxacum kok-saghyz]